MAAGPIIYPPQPITYEEYMTEALVKRRYDIINGVRVFAVPPSLSHQSILGNILSLLSDYGDRHDAIALYSLFDVLITRSPFCTRQPDVMLLSEEHWQQHGADDGRPLTVPPELVVEILSSPDRELSVGAKLRDYCAIGTQECWIVTPDTHSVEVVHLSSGEIESRGVYGPGQQVSSLMFDGLTVPVNDIFAEEG